MKAEEHHATTLQVETVDEDESPFGPPTHVEVPAVEAGAPHESATRTTARLYLIGAAIYALYPVLVGAEHGVFGTGHDLATLGMACCLLVLAAAIRFLPQYAGRPAVMNGTAAYLISGHMLVIAWQRHLDPAAVVAVLMVMAAMVTSLPFTMPSRAVLQGYSLLMAVGALIVGLFVPDPEVEPAVLLFSVGALAVVALVSQTAWLRIVGRLQAAERTRRTVVRNAPIALFALDPSGRVRMAEGKGLVALGLDPARLVGRQLTLDDPDVPAVLVPALRARPFASFEQLLMQDGRTYEAAYEPIGVGQGELGVIVVVNDITARAEAEAALVEREKRATHDSLHDPLTGLPNRDLLHDRLDRALGRLLRRPEDVFAVMFMDLDRFKNINDGLGHLVGDELLMHFARRLKLCIRPSDTLARLGGDEFALLLEDVGEAGEVNRVAQRIRETLKIPFHLRGHEVVVSASIGIAMSGTHYERPEELLRDADIAMYRAKDQGRDQYVIFNQRMHEEAMALVRLESDLRKAIQRSEFVLHFQPLVSFAYQRICGFEALVRWQHPTRGLLHPAAFIEMAEETGLIVPLGKFVLRRACEAIKRLMDLYPDRSWMRMSINLSARQFTQADLVQDLRAVIDQTGVKPSWLVFEITESLLMEDLDEVLPILEGMRELGVHIEIDDFGTGYSSLAYLHRIPFDRIKIDRSFVGQMELGLEQVALVQTITNLARNLGVGVVAEGVETVEQCRKVSQLGADVGQGYYFAAPMPLHEAIVWMERNPEWPEARWASSVRAVK